MKSMIYVGNIPGLKGETALVREDPRPGLVQVQFDKAGLAFAELDLSHGWHLFREDDFAEQPAEGEVL